MSVSDLVLIFLTSVAGGSLGGFLGVWWAWRMVQLHDRHL